MSKLKSIFLILACGVLLSACGSGEINTANGATGGALDTMDMDVTLDITVGGEEAVSIPDPAQATGDIPVILHDGKELSEYEDKYCDDEISESEYNEYYSKFISSLFADLSFAGFENKVLVSSYAVGTITKKDSSMAQIHNVNTGKEETNPGNCLVLHIIDGLNPDECANPDKPLYEEFPEREQEEDYLLFIDYGNKTFYKARTNFFLHAYSYWLDMQLADLTGDGLDELLIQHCYNRSIDAEVYRYDAETQEVKTIYSTWVEEEELQDKFTFYGKLKDDYKVEVGIREIDFSEEISLLDTGKKAEEMEMTEESRYGGDASWIERIWKDKKLQKTDSTGGDIEVDAVSLYTIDDIQVENNAEEMPELIIRNYMMIRHRSFWAGDLLRHLQYDEETDRFKIVSAEVDLHHPEYDEEEED